MTTGIIAIRSASSLGRARRARWSASLTLRASIAAKIGLATTYDSCMRSEEEATQLIAKDWATFPTADRTLCAQPGGYMPNYVEWLTCFEMQRDTRKMRKEESASPKARF